MSASTHLAQFGVTVEQARSFILNNIASPSVIFDTASNYGVTNEMLAEIYGGVTRDDVVGFFNSVGIDSSILDSVTPPDTDSITLLSDDLNALYDLVTLNNYTGELSTLSIRADVIAITGEQAYFDAFDPSSYLGAGDGIFSEADLGVPGLGDLPATAETLESIFYGTLINALKAVDAQEVVELNSFLSANSDALNAGDTAVTNQYVAMVLDIYIDPAVVPVFPDADIADVAVIAGNALVTLTGQSSDVSVLDGVISAFSTS
ncbi:hypothetical protein [Pontibacterium sp.]|uniref:hypothetical protein n=1 Tax=Pontibacterium sp. TaxID=2036026 RepID=UPI0035673FE1